MKISKYNTEGYLDPTTYDALMNIERERRAENIDGLKQRVPNFRPIIYICSPYAGDIDVNVRNARNYCRFAIQRGCIPVAPHLLFPQFLDDSVSEQRELGLFMGYVLMTKCVEVWVFGDTISPGMAAEIVKAEARCMPVRYFTADCKEVSE